MPRDDFDWNDLRYLLAAARAGTLAGAARALGVEHTTIGRRLAALEKALGGSLVLRKPDGLALTALGQRVLQAAGQVEAAIGRVHEAASGGGTRVRLALPSGFTSLFAGRLDALVDAKPRVALELVSGSRAVDLANGECDIALRGGPITDPDLVARRLGDVAWALYAAPSYLLRKPFTPGVDALAGHELVGYDAGFADTPPARWLDQHGVRATVALRSREMTDMASAAASGAGLALLPCFVAEATPPLVRLPVDTGVSRDIWMVYRPEARTSAAVQAVAAFVVQVVGEAAGVLAGKSGG